MKYQLSNIIIRNLMEFSTKNLEVGKTLQKDGLRIFLDSYWKRIEIIQYLDGNWHNSLIRLSPKNIYIPK